MFKKNVWIATIAILLLCGGSAIAKVDSEQASKLNSVLTPFGSERAGNAEGTIPEWTGGLTPDKAPSSWKSPNGYRPDPYPEDKVLFTITAQNIDQYADKLTEGLKALLTAYPDTFNIPVYPSHRSHALPEWINENTVKNATTVELVDDGNGISDNAKAGILFPIPQTALEVMWNYLLRYQGVYSVVKQANNEVQPNGKVTLNHRGKTDNVFHFYKKDGIKGRYRNFAWSVTGPARFAGDGVLVIDSINASKDPRKAWIYTAAERRVRRAPTLNFDTPDYSTTTYDDYEMYNGSPERYDWHLVGKKEMYIPYNNYRANLPDLKYTDLQMPHNLNPEYLRYELHRVWVIEATLKQNSRHIYSKRTFYIDEDSWCLVATDKYDGNGNLWRTSLSYLMTYYDVPLTNFSFFVHYDLKNGVYMVVSLTNEEKGSFDFTKAPPRESYFTPQAMRRRGR